MYKDFQEELYGRKVIETEKGMIIYAPKASDESLYLHGIYVKPIYRLTGAGTELLNMVITKEDPRFLVSYVDLTTINPEVSIQAHLASGFLIINSNETSITFGKQVK